MAGTTRASRVETLRWRDGRIEMIDQRVLSARFDYVSCNSAQEVADAIRTAFDHRPAAAKRRKNPIEVEL